MSLILAVMRLIWQRNWMIFISPTAEVGLKAFFRKIVTSGYTWPESFCQEWSGPFPSGSNAPMLSPFFAPLLWSQSRRDFHFFMLYYFVTTTRFSSILFNSLHLKHRHLQSSACQLGPKLTYNSSPYYCNIAISHQDKFSLRHTP